MRIFNKMILSLLVMGAFFSGSSRQLLGMAAHAGEHSVLKDIKACHGGCGGTCD
jgi:hypothetical protein